MVNPVPPVIQGGNTLSPEMKEVIDGIGTVIISGPILDQYNIEDN